MRTIEITMHFTVLRKDILLNLLLEFLTLHKVVFSAMDLTLPGPAGCVTDAKLEYFWVFLEQVVDECPLPHARTSTDDQWLIFLGVFLVVKECKVIPCVVVHIFRLLQ